jgi:cell wall-associated NlpC family hydrolase
MGTTRGGEFLPDGQRTKADLALVLARALGLRGELAGLDAIATDDGTALPHPRQFPALALAGALRLFRNHFDESRELLPGSRVPRDDAAYALSVAAAAAGTWRIRALQRFRSVRLPATTPERRAVVEFALAHVGFPYVKAGEWPSRTAKGYCCGAQLQGGFDCSGFVWWVLRERGGGYNPGRSRPYAGWPIAERSSARMAQAATPRLAPDQLRAGDLLFSDVDGKGNDWAAIDHVGLAVGGGWMIHASSPGVLLDWIGDGWWASRLRFGRTVIGTPQEETTPPPPTGEPTPRATPSASTPAPTPSS